MKDVCVGVGVSVDIVMEKGKGRRRKGNVKSEVTSLPEQIRCQAAVTLANSRILTMAYLSHI